MDKYPSSSIVTVTVFGSSSSDIMPVTVQLDLEISNKTFERDDFQKL